MANEKEKDARNDGARRLHEFRIEPMSALTLHETQPDRQEPLS